MIYCKSRTVAELGAQDVLETGFEILLADF
jgi:hypothetical protein